MLGVWEGYYKMPEINKQKTKENQNEKNPVTDGGTFVYLRVGKHFRKTEQIKNKL